MNHVFASSQGILSGNRLDAALREINQRRFSGVYELRRDGDHWEVHHPLGWNFGFSCWLATSRKVEFRRELGDWACWVVTVFQDEIAAQFKGRCSGEGVGGTWTPEPEKFPNYKAYWWYCHTRYMSEGDPRISGLWERTESRIPEALRRFVS